MIVQTGSGAKVSTQVMVAAIAHDGADISITPPVQVGGEGVSSPAALSWYDADNLVVLSQAGTASAQIFKVPVNGAEAISLTPEADAVSLSAGGAQIAAGLTGGRMAVYSVTGQSWRPLPSGQDPVFPG
jgi:hypothetical protein